jgi:hypothetical protein
MKTLNAYAVKFVNANGTEQTLPVAAKIPAQAKRQTQEYYGAFVVKMLGAKRTGNINVPVA